MAAPEWGTPVDFLALFDEATRARLVERARQVVVPAGAVSEYPQGQFVADIVQAGLVRAFQVSEDGREATIGYLYAGEYLGVLPSLPPRPVVYVQPILPTTMLRLDAGDFRKALETGSELSRVLAIHAATVLSRVVRVVTVRTLGNVKQRIAFDLLERASRDQLRSGLIELAVTHEVLAGSVGSMREVASRALGELRSAGIVSMGRGRVRVDDPIRLTKVVQGLVV